MKAMDCALRADWSIAGKTVISQFLLGMIRAGIGELLEGAFGLVVASIAGLRDRC